MISLIISTLLSLGIPAVITGILGKLAPSWLGKLGALSGFLQPIIALCVGLVDVLLTIIRWGLDKILKGLDHIVQSVPATFTVLLLMWLSYGYGQGLEKILPKLPEVTTEARGPPSSGETGRSWFDTIFDQ